MKKFAFLFAFLYFCQTGFAQSLLTPFEESNGTETATYQQGITFWKKLAARFPEIKMLTEGLTDSGYPLNLVIYSTNKDFNPDDWHLQQKVVILINNAIHPGEPDGVDASMLLVRDLATGKIKMPTNVVLAVIPFYNIGGVLNRNSFTRANQNGPVSYGFRGNAQNLDLNRDFIKCDSWNAVSFAKIFHWLNPDIFIDNHVSDGADYQHIMTLLVTQHDKLGGVLGEYLHNQMVPGIYALMKQKGYDLVPYVNVEGEVPDSGWAEFYDSPRYSTGYTTLFQTFGFMPEMHMLKPFKERVWSDYALMQSFINYAGTHAKDIIRVRTIAQRQVLTQMEFPLEWKVDSVHFSLINFKGYAAKYKPSQISGLPRLYYDHNEPYDKKVRFYDYFTPEDIVRKPIAYIIPQGWHTVIDLLRANDVQMQRLDKDTDILVGVYHILHYQSLQHPFEKHHLNEDVQVSLSADTIHFLKGDYMIPTNQSANRYIVETLEPTGEDSFFAWNFFDAILQEKEYFSSYVFEDKAAAYLQQHLALKDSLDVMRKKNPGFAEDARAQLNYVYRHSPWMEPEYMRYPVYRLQ